MIDDFYFTTSSGSSLTADTEAPVLRVSSSSPPHALAGSIAKMLRVQPIIHLHAMGLAAVYQALKATIIARDYLTKDGLDLIQQPAFLTVEDGFDAKRTAVRITIRAFPV